MSAPQRTGKAKSRIKPTRRSLSLEEREAEDATSADEEFRFVKRVMENELDFAPLRELPPEEIQAFYEADEKNAVNLAMKGNFRPLIALLKDDNPYAGCKMRPPRQQLSKEAWTLILAKMEGGKQPSNSNKIKRGPKPMSTVEKIRDNPVHLAAARVDMILYLIRMHRQMKFLPFEEKHWQSACVYAARLSGLPDDAGGKIRRYLRRSRNDRHRIAVNFI